MVSSDIVTKVTENSNNFAISSTGIGTALQRSASALAAGGNTLEESIAMITAANEIAQSPEHVGTSLKTLSMYLRSAKVEAQEAGIATEGMASSTAKLRETILALTKNRVDIMADPTTIKSTYQVYKEISKVYDSMTDVDQAALLEALGGKRNANITAALIKNFKTAEEAMQSATNSAGSAEKENSRYLDSIQGRMAVLSSTFQSFSKELINSDAFKTLISGATVFLDVLTKLMEVFGALPVTMSAAAAAWKTYNKIKDAAESARRGIDAEPYGTTEIPAQDKSRRTDVTFDVDEVEKANSAVSEYDKKIKELSADYDEVSRRKDTASVVMVDRDSDKKLGQSLKGSVADADELIDKTGKLNAQLDTQNRRSKEFAKNLGSASVETGKITGSFKKINLSGIGNNLLEIGKAAATSFAVGAAIQLVVTAVDMLVHARQEAAEKAIDNANAARKESDATRETTNSVQSLIDKYKQYGSLSTADPNMEAENRATLISLQKELNQSVGDEATKVDLVNGEYRTQFALLKKIKEAQDAKQREADSGTVAYDIDAMQKSYRANKSKDFKPFSFNTEDAGNQRALRALTNSKHSRFFGTGSVDNKGVFNALIQGDGIKSTLDQYKEVNEQINIVKASGVKANNEILIGLQAIANMLKEDLSSSFDDAQNALSDAVSGEALKNEFESGKESISNYRKELIKAVSGDDAVSQALTYGLLSPKQIRDAIDEYLSQAYSSEYFSQIVPEKQLNSIAKRFANPDGGKLSGDAKKTAKEQAEQFKKQLEDAFNNNDEIQIAYSFMMDETKSFKNVDALKKAVENHIDYMTSSDYVADTLRDKLSGILEDEGNKSAVKSLQKLANTTGIKASDIQDFADKSAELADILNMDGVSAEFLAGVLQREFSNDNIGAGISSITNKSIDLNKALGGMEKALDQASKAKDRYDSAMSKGNSDTGFRSISDAFTKAYTAAQAGMTGSGSTDFWAGSEYIFGGDQLKEWGYDTQTIVNHLKEMAPLLSNADSAGSGLAQKLMEMANDSGQIVINGENLGTAYTDQNGIYNIDIPVENFHKIADAMGVSDAAFTDAINAAKEWANVTTFSTNDVYNELRSVGDVLDNTSGAFKNFASAEIIDTKTLQQMGIAGADLEKFKRELESTGNNYVFLDLQTSAENAIKSLKDLGVAEEDAESGKLEINTKSLNTLLAGLEYSKEEVKSLYDALKETTGMSDDDIAKAMENFGHQTENSAGAVEKVRNALEAVKDKKVILEIKTIMDGVAADPNSITARQPNMGAIKDFADSVYNVPQINQAMQTAASTIDQGFQNWFTNLENRRKELESLLDMSDVTVYSEDYAQTFRDQMQAAHDEANYYRSLGLDDTDDHIQKAKQKWHEGLQGLLAYDKQYYEQRKSLMDDVISQLEEDPFGDAASNADQIISAYQQIYEGAAEAREKALAKGYPPNSEFIRSLEAEMRTAINKMEDTRRNAFKSLLSYGELNADIMERDRHDGQSTEEIAAIYSGLMSQVESEMSRVRAEGAAANNDYLMELTRQWYDYRDKVREAQKQVYQEQANWAKHLTTMQEYSLVGNSNKASMIGMYQNEQMALLGEISNLAAMGYSETDQEIYSLREQIAALNRSILEVQKELAMQPAEWAKHNTAMAQFRVNRGHADPREMISFYEQEQAALQSAIYQMSALGYSYTDQEIYSLVEQIEALNDSIMDANAAWVREQDQIWKVHEKELSNKHASPIEMMQYYGDMWRRAEENYYAMLRIGYGASTSEVQGYYNDYLDYIAKEQEAYKQAMQESIDVYGYYRKQLDVGKYPFEEYVRVIHEEMDNVQHMTEELRKMGYHEESSEIVSLKTQGLQLIEDLKSEALKAMSEVDRKFQHQLKMIEYQYGEAMTVELSLPVLNDQQKEYEKLLKQFRELGYAEDSEQVSGAVEKIWEIREQRLQLYKRQIDDMIAVSDHAISVIYDRQKYNYTEYLSEYTSMQDAVHDAANKARAEGLDENDEFIRGMKEKWWEYEDKIAAVFKKLVDDANEALESVKGAYDDFFAAAEDYAKYGTLTYDTFKSLLDLGPEYMAYLQNSNGALEMNKKTLKQVIAARAEELAVNTALNYVDELRRARQSDNFETINRMTKGITEAADATWGLVYANLELIDLTDTQYAGALKNINAYRSLTRQFALNIDTALNQENIKSIDDLTGSFDDFVGYVEDMIKAEHEDMKDALDDQLELYEDIVKKKKEALDLAKEEADYEQSVADQVKQIAKLQNQIDQLSLDTSREATAKRQKLEEDLASATRKLADEQSKHSLDATKDQLDADVDAMKQSTDKQKEAIDEETSSAEKLHRLAMDRIMQYANGNLDRLLDEVLDWNLKAGNSLERNIKDTWQDIVTLVERYGSLVGAIEAIRANSLKETVNSVVNGGGSSSSSTIGDAVVVDGGDKIRVGNKFYDEMTGSEMKEYAQSMIANAIDWWLAKAVNDKNRQDARAADNERIAKTFRDYGMGLNKTAEGRWMVSGAKNQLLFDNNDVGEYVRNIVRNNEAKAAMLGDDGYDYATKKDLQRKNANYMNALANYTGAKVQYRDGKWYYNGVLLENVGTFHKGGIAGNSSTLKQDEVMAKLQKGELILNKERQKGLFKLVDLASYLSEKLGVSLKKTNLSLSGGGITQDLGITPSKPTNQVNSNFSFAPSINVTISGGTDDPNSARRYAKQIADMTLGNLKDAFAQRGITKALAKA